jgi:hypothetical protein
MSEPSLVPPRLGAPARVAATIIGVALTTLGVIVAPAGGQPAWAAATVSVVNATGGTTADPEFATPVTVSGSGFQSIQGGFGGIYVLFGWVDAAGSWKPTNGGVVGDDYRYVPDQESKDNAGFQRFIAFPGSETESAANGVLAADGSWTVDMVIPAGKFESQDRSGAVSSVNCLEVQCGVITIGAHGVKNANNETFTPINFVAPAAATAPGAVDAAGTAPAAPVASGLARVGYTGTSAVAGNALTFTGQGFGASEQVVATLDDGVVAVGPLTAGLTGEVAGVLPLPADLRSGTHLLTLVGAASGSTAEAEITVAATATAGLPTTIPAATEPAIPAWLYVVMAVAIFVALVLLVTSLVTLAVRSAKRRKELKAESRAAAHTPAPAANTQPASSTGLRPRHGSPADAQTETLEVVK